MHYESWFLKCFVNIEMLNLVYESKVEYANMKWYVVLVYWSKNIFFDKWFMSFCLNAANWERAMFTIESNLEATTKANIEIEAKTKTKARSRSSVVLNTKFKYAVDAKYFRKRSRSRLNEFEKISDFDFWSIETTNWSFDWDIIDDFETNAVNDESIMIDDEFSRSWLSS